MRARPGRHALLVGTIISVLAHLLLFRLDPTLQFVPLASSGAQQPVEGDPARLISIRIATSPVPAPLPVRSPSSFRTPSAPADVERPSTEGTPAGAVAGDVRADVPTSSAERLRYRPSAIWARPAPAVESVADCRRRELRERLEKGIADSAYGRLPPTSGRPAGAIISIPFGRKPPPPAQTVPAPLPDSLRLAGDGARESSAPAVVRRPPGCGDPILAHPARRDTLSPEQR